MPDYCDKQEGPTNSDLEIQIDLGESGLNAGVFSTLGLPFRLMAEKFPTPWKIIDHVKNRIARALRDREDPSSTTILNFVQRYCKGLFEGFIDHGMEVRRHYADIRAYHESHEKHPPVDTLNIGDENLEQLLELDRLRHENREDSRGSLKEKYLKEAEVLLRKEYLGLPVGKIRLAALGLVSNPNIQLGNFFLVIISVALSHLADGASINDQDNSIAGISNNVQSSIIGMFVANALAEVVAHGPKRVLNPATIIDFAMGYFQFIATGYSGTVNTSGRLIRLTSLIKHLKVSRSVARALGAGRAAVGAGEVLSKSEETMEERIKPLDPNRLEDVNKIIVGERDEILVRNTTWTIFIIIAFEVTMRLLDPGYQSDQSSKSQWFNFYRNIAFDLIVFGIGVFNSMQIRKNTRAIADQVSNNAVASANAGPVRAANERLGRLQKDSVDSGVEYSSLIESLKKLYKSMLTAEEVRSFDKERKLGGVSNNELVNRISVKLNEFIEVAVRGKNEGSGDSSSLNEDMLKNLLGNAVGISAEELERMSLAKVIPRLLTIVRDQGIRESDANRRAPDDTEPVSAFDNTEPVSAFDNTEPVSAFDSTEPVLQVSSDVVNESTEGLEALLKIIFTRLHRLGIKTDPEIYEHLMALLRKLYSLPKSVK